MKIEVLGVYALSADDARFRKFFCEYCGVNHIDGDLRDYDEQLFENAHNAALIEITVEDARHEFDAGLLAQENPTQPPSMWQVAWNEAYLTEDGESIATDRPQSAASRPAKLRVAFYIHCFAEHPMISYAGTLIPLPAATTLPERLWRLVPYELP